MMLSLPFAEDDRLLVLGAGGWFGRTLTHVLPNGPAVLGTASRPREGLVRWDLEEIREFGPTCVVNFAFLTPDRLAAVGLADFVRVNSELTHQFLASLELPTVRCGLVISSGAAASLPSEPYGELKRLEESAALAMAGPGRTVLVGRAYSLSGPFVR